ncbi:MAG: DUF1727 domain-containing protein [Candidatus Levybacteria bacterium]|nr:DUF1727 domain-containing protein [Candidatus Levybacteria bacterium]
MINLFLIVLGKMLSFAIQSLNLGNGSTWPGHIALLVNKNFIQDMLRGSKVKIVIVAGTNGKTTTTKMIRTILEASGKTVLQNHSGANLLNGIASSLLLHSNILSTINADYAIFEIDENTLPLIIKELTPDYVLLLNLFRDQLDRYGEVHTIAKKWGKTIALLPEKTTLMLNADDPEIANLGKGVKAGVLYFGLGEEVVGKKTHEHAVDSVYCPRCGSKLSYKKIFFSHLGIWKCNACTFSRSHLNISNYTYYPLTGIYNMYNTLSAVLLARTIRIDGSIIQEALKKFSPAFGRQESIVLNGKKIKIFLSKNPTGFNESLRTITSLQGKTILLALNDRIADGRDVSWIWDIDMEEFVDGFSKIVITGDRAYDMGLRVKYSFDSKNQNYLAKPDLAPRDNSKVKILERSDAAVSEGLNRLDEKETLYILPTYTAMLEIRKILTGKKIL